MRLFWNAVMMNLKVYLAYPRGFMISIVIHPIILAMNIYLFTSIYAYNGTSQIKGYDLAQMIWYYGATMFIWVFVFNFADRRMSNYILSGDLSTMLLRPMSVYRFELASAIALRTAGVLFEFLPGICVFTLIYPPVFLSSAAFGKFLTVVVLSFLINFQIRYLIGMSAFVTQNNAGLNRAFDAVLTLLGGAMIPLDFFPEWLRRVCDVLPFRYIFYEPLQFFLNRTEVADTSEWLRALGIQLVWIAGLYMLARLVWNRLLKQVVVAGG